MGERVVTKSGDGGGGGETVETDEIALNDGGAG